MSLLNLKRSSPSDLPARPAWSKNQAVSRTEMERAEPTPSRRTPLGAGPRWLLSKGRWGITELGWVGYIKAATPTEQNRDVYVYEFKFIHLWSSRQWQEELLICDGQVSHAIGPTCIGIANPIPIFFRYKLLLSTLSHDYRGMNISNHFSDLHFQFVN